MVEVPPDRAGEGLPSVTLLDLQGAEVDLKKMQGSWLLLIFLRHLG
ncbi:MAG: hypothetical protein JRC87_01715 [Deltaproteobacteria bacterium]|nr:hypothetical protein [Deltaproteobacteria bacterium]MBW2658307.1 hypothetical protein [Deltaproteobacteria bacterium]